MYTISPRICINISFCLFFTIYILSLSGPHKCVRCQALLAGSSSPGARFASTTLELNRSIFPPDFSFGVGSSAYQYEGASNEDGRGNSIWDTFTRLNPEKIADESSGEIAEEFYYLFKEDVRLLKETGWDFFRFSISWPRLLPYGKVSKGVNQRGIDFYNKLIDELVAHGIQPFVTIFHWDVPQALEDEYGGFLSRDIVDDYQDYADLCFKEFGDRVKHWITLNEPNLVASFGFATGDYAPGRCSDYIGNCTEGDSATEPYIVVHNQLLSHASAVNLYRSNYQASQKGEIGLSTSIFWMEPKYETNNSITAASRALDFQTGWILSPIFFGDYPESMRDLVGARLPNFTTIESEMLTGSYDFIGVNYYTARYVDESSSYSTTNLSYTTDCRCNQTVEKDGILIGEPTSSGWLYIYPEGIKKVLHYIKDTYNPAVIYVTESGMSDPNNSSLSVEDALTDYLRIEFFKLHLSCLAEAIEEGVNVKGFMAWTFLDDFEWAEGYTNRYGITYIDFDDGLKRYPKDSSLWFKQFLLKENATAHDHSHLHASF